MDWLSSAPPPQASATAGPLGVCFPRDPRYHRPRYFKPNKKMSETTTTWPELAISLFEKLTGRGAEVTYEFENLEVYVPNIMGADAKHGHWKLNGIVKIRTRETAGK